MLVAGSVAARQGDLGRASRRHRRRSSRATTSARTRSSRRRLGFIPRRSVVEAVADLLGRDRHQGPLDSSPTRATTTSAGCSSSTRCSPASRSSARSCEPPPRPDHRRRRSACFRPRGAAGRRAEVSVARPRGARHHRRRGGGRAPSARSGPTWSSTAPPSTTWRCASSEEDRSFEVNARAVKRLAERCAEHGAKFVHLSTNYVFDGTAAGPVHRGRRRPRREASTRSRSWPASTRRSPTRPTRSWPAAAGLYGLHGSASKGGNFVTRMVCAGPRAGRSSRWSPTSG